ncbi:ATP-binding protein [Brevundimonas sp.]|uniref:ATP-binding protein n=1 Tax=Brevundimonas TaxID=41275 RepID=UPI00342A06A6
MGYARSELIVAVADDGVGIPADILSHGRAGHFGLSGMRERARAIGARLAVEAGADGGTAVTVRIRVRGAYFARLLKALPLWSRTPHD